MPPKKNADLVRFHFLIERADLDALSAHYGRRHVSAALRGAIKRLLRTLDKEKETP